MSDTLTPELHRQQIEAYTEQYPDYVIYAQWLERVLKACCAVSLPEAFVQARAKSVPSFAEKCARRFKDYPDAVNQFTDLCGGRVIVQTLEQVEAVCRFVAKNFQVLERDDKTTRLKTDQFGYRDMHFIIQVPADCPLGFTAKDRNAIGRRRAELQVRTWVQHAWADTLHDRMYKTPLRLSSEIQRRGNLLAAVMEEGDRGFNRLAHELDGMLANYSAYAHHEDVEKEIVVQRLLLANADDPSRPGIALKLARLIATQGQWAEVVSLLEPHDATAGPLGLALRSELGHALCHLDRSNPTSATCRRGQRYLEQVIAAFDSTDLSAVPNLRRDACVQARALARLGWSYEPIEAEAHEARRWYARAVELEPENPYYLVEMLGFELHYAREPGLLASFRSTIRAALAACREHETSGTELPASHFAAGRLLLLLDEPMPALHAYARGIRHCLHDEGISPCDALSKEIAWLHRINAGRRLPEQQEWAKNLLMLGVSFGNCGADQPAPGDSAEGIRAPVLIVAGGAGSLQQAALPHVQAMLHDALDDFPGTVLSGGTTSGVPGAVGAVAADLAQKGRKRFLLRGYIPRSLPYDAEKDKRYDQIVVSGADHFSPEQILRGWNDVLAAGIGPSDVLLLGFGGGPIAAFEYRLALALGATVGVVDGSGGSADALLEDPLWSTLPLLFPLPADSKTLRAFVVPDGSKYEPDDLEVMAQEFHARYRAANRKRIRPDSLKDWIDLPATYKKANLEQAAYAIRILEAARFGVRKADREPVVFREFTPDEIDLMAQMEHGRWNIERLSDGWRYGPRDDAKKLHNCLTAWDKLSDGPDGVKRFDRIAVAAFPEILAKAGFEVYRP